jgi:hypothetical protein
MSEERLTIQETWAKLTRAACPRDVYPCGDNCYACWRTHAPEMLVALVDGDYPRVRRALSAVDPVTAGLERLARAYHTAAWEGDVIAPSEVVDAWDALLDAGWTGEESEEEEESDG